MKLSTPQFVDTQLLRIAYEERTGQNGSGRPIVLLHGWPDDVRTWDGVTDALVESGYRTIAPWLRGYGPTRFHESATLRSGQIAALAQDIIDLLDALKIDRVTFLGQDWGARTGYALAALFPERIERMIVCSAGYETGIKSGDKIDPLQARAYWYQWFWHTERGREALEKNRRDICRFLWQTWSPHLQFATQEFEETAKAWENPDWVECTLHAYRVRWGAAPRDPTYDGLEKRLAGRPTISVPTIVLHGEEDGASLVASSADQEADFSGGYRRVTLPGVGHFIQRQDPKVVIDAVLNG